MKIQKINLYQNYNSKSYVIKKQNNPSFKGQDSFESKEDALLKVKYDEKIGDFCFESKQYDASLFYYENAIKELAKILLNGEKDTSQYSKEEQEIKQYDEQYRHYLEEMEEYNNKPFFKKMFKKEPKMPQKPALGNSVSNYNKKVLILSNLYIKAAMAYHQQGMNDIYEKYMKISKSILKNGF